MRSVHVGVSHARRSGQQRNNEALIEKGSVHRITHLPLRRMRRENLDGARGSAQATFAAVSADDADVHKVMRHAEVGHVFLLQLLAKGMHLV